MQLAREHDLFAVAIVLDLPEESASRATRRGRTATSARTWSGASARSCSARCEHLQREGFRRVHVLRRVEDVDGVEIVRAPMWTDRRAETGPFDIIGDVHGCYDELVALLGRAGLRRRRAPGRAGGAVFVGDLVDRGPGVATCCGS